MTQLIPVVSSNLTALGYDPATQVLTAEFPGKSFYAYEAVPASVFDELMAAESKGGAFSKLIKKGGFAFKKLEAPNGP